MMHIYSSSDLRKIAESITNTSEVFGDEVTCVQGELQDVLSQAETLGCDITTEIHDMWGGKVCVVAHPAHARHEWIFGDHKATPMLDALRKATCTL